MKINILKIFYITKNLELNTDLFIESQFYFKNILLDLEILKAINQYFKAEAGCL